MKKYILIILIIFSTFNSKLCSEEKCTFVSLGSHCHPAFIIKYANRRLAAYPLDWVLSVNGDKIIEMLESKFEYFLDEKFLIPINSYLTHQYYNIEFAHEGIFSEENYHIKIRDFKEKYERRIKRFLALNNEDNGKVYFIRSAWPLSNNPNYIFNDEKNINISEEYASRLCNALEMIFPDLNFCLVILNPSEIGKEDVTKLNQKTFVIRVGAGINEILRYCN